MANEQNLRPRRELSTEEAKRMGSVGGKASVAARREIKLIKQAIAERMGAEDFNEMIDNLIERAKAQDKSFEVLRDSWRTETCGEN